MTPPEWRYPTLADSGVTGPARCPCGRQRDATRMLEVRSLGVGEAYLCAGCVEDLFRKEQVDRVTFYRRGGAPADWLENVKETLRNGPLSQTGLPEEIWGEILTDHLEETLPVEERWETLLAVEAAKTPPPV